MCDTPTISKVKEGYVACKGTLHCAHIPRPRFRSQKTFAQVSSAPQEGVLFQWADRCTDCGERLLRKGMRFAFLGGSGEWATPEGWREAEVHKTPVVLTSPSLQ